MKRPYPKYTQSKTDWLGLVPEHWAIDRLSRHSTVVNGYPFDSTGFNHASGVPLVRIRDLTAGFTDTLFEGDCPKEAVVDNGDLLIAMDGDFTVRWWMGGRGVLNQRCCSIRTPNYINRRYLYYLLPFPLGIINDLTYFTTVKHLASGDIETLLVPFPPEPERAFIVAYLDDKTREIDTLIEKKQRLIELLKEQRTAIINQAVTKGLNPNVRMKDSGIEWIGEIPEHWSVRKIKRLANGLPNSFVDGDWVELPFITDSGVRLIQTGNIGIGQYREQGFRYISEQSFIELGCTEVKPGDVLICRLADPVGRACLAPDLGSRMITSVDVCILRPSPTFDPRYIVYQLSTHRYLTLLEAISRGGTRERISRTMLGAVHFVSPPLFEQEAIAEYLDNRTKQIDQTIDQFSNYIQLVKEYRTALISEVVTGKIDVRDELAS